MLSPHRLSEKAFTALASGYGDPGVVMQLREVQHSKHLMLLLALTRDCDGIGLPTRDIAAFRAAYDLLASVQATGSDAVSWLFTLPHVGGWAHDCLARLDQGLPPDLGYVPAMAAAAAVRAGLAFELDVPASEGRVPLPGLGWLHGLELHGADQEWITLRSDGERLTAGARIGVPGRALVPDDGSAGPVPHWQGTPEVRATAGGRTWTVLLETADRHLDRYGLPMAAGLPAGDVANWRRVIQSAWEVVVRDHEWAAGPLAAGTSVIVPLTARSEAGLDSATTLTAFGAIAATWCADPVIMAEILVHEFQHLKLCGLLDIVPLTRQSGGALYAPWREDPRPATGLLQGVYAHLGVARFWNAQRHVETEPEAILRAEVLFAHWRGTIAPTINTLLQAGCLTPTGVRLAGLLLEQGQRLESEAVSAGAREIAREVALNHRLTWQFRHTALDPAEVTALAAAYRRGEPSAGHALPEGRVEADTRQVDSTTRSRLLDMQYLQPGRFGRLGTAGWPGLSEGDSLLISGEPDKAVDAYREEIRGAPGPLPGAWTGLALALQLQPCSPLQQAFSARLPLIFDVHACLSGQGMRNDPLELAAWFT